MKERTKQTLRRLSMRVTALAVMLAMALAAVARVPMDVFAAKSDQPARYSVLLLDVGGETHFYCGSELIYTADSAIDYVKASARTFLADLLNADGENYVAVVTYAENAEVVTDFTDDIDKVTTLVDGLESESNIRNLSDGLDKTNDLLSAVADDATKNVILVTTGMVDTGNYSYNGIYDESTVGSDWYNGNPHVYLYAYANAAYERCEKINEAANLYVLGLFQTMEGMPEDGKDIAQFFRISAKDFASSEDTFFEIEDPSDIGFFFGEVSDDILDTVVSDNVSRHIDFINNDPSAISYSYSDIFTKVNSMAFMDKGVSARTVTEVFSAYCNPKNWHEESLEEVMRDVSNSEFVAQAIVTQILSSEEFKAKITDAGKTGVGMADEKLLLTLKYNPDRFSVSDADKDVIEEMINESNKSSDEYISKRTAFIKKYYTHEAIEQNDSSDSWISGLSEIVGLVTDAEELLETFDRMSYNYNHGKHSTHHYPKHMEKPKENKIFQKVKIANFILSEADKIISTKEDIKVFYENVYALTSANYAVQESIAILTENLKELRDNMDGSYWTNDTKIYVTDIIRYLEEIQNAFGENYTNYEKEKIIDGILGVSYDTIMFSLWEELGAVLVSCCPDVKLLAVMIPTVTYETLILLGGLLTNVDERTTERGYTLVLGKVLKALEMGYYNKGAYGYFSEKLLNDKTDYSVELYETGLCLYKIVAEMYQKHAVTYLSMLRRSTNLADMAEYILLPEDYKELFRGSLLRPDSLLVYEQIKTIASQLNVDIYSINIWLLDVLNTTCHTGGSNPNTFVHVETKKKYYLIACPVDVSVMKNRTEVAKVVNDQLSILENDPNVQIFTFMGEESDNLTKALLVPYDYDVNITGYDEGTMNVDKAVIDDGNLTDLAILEDIPVEPGVRFVEVVEDNKLVNIVSEPASYVKITSQPASVKAKNGAKVSFTVKAEGDGLTYQWQLSDDKGKTWRDSSAKTAKYTATLSEKNNGRYVRCIVTDQYGKSEPSNAASMKIVTLSVISQPRSVTLLKGDTATFKVSAAGEKLTYQWQLSDDKGKTWRNSSTKTPKYTTTLSQKNNGRYVRCVVTDKYGNSVKSDAAYMKITSLKIVTQPKSMTGKKGAKVSFAVAANGPGVTYQWQLSDDQGKTWRDSSTKNAKYTATLSYDNSGRMVRCVVTDKHGNAVTSDAVYLAIRSLRILRQPVNANLLSGATASFSVVTAGEGVKYQWILSDDQGKTWRNSSTKTAVYTTKLTALNNGRYVRCVVTDKYGDRVTSNAAIMKISALKITAQPVNVTQDSGTTVSFAVAATGPGITYQWQLSDDMGKTWRDSSTKKAKYTTTLSRSNDGRAVRCVVTDKYGNTVTSRTVYMKISSLRILTQPASVTLLQGATASFKVVTAGKGVSYQWQLSDDAGKTWRNSSAKTATYAATLTYKNNGRYVRCVVTDRYGNSVKSKAAVMCVTTLQITSQPVNAKAAKGKEVSFDVKANGPGVTYQWQLSDDQGRTWRNSSCTSATYAVTVTDTNNGRYVRCIVTDKFGNSVKSNAAIMKIK